MLAQQTPRSLCRACLYTQAGSIRYRSLGQVRCQSTESTQNNDSANVEETPRRIPLRELIERRKLDSPLTAEPLAPKPASPASPASAAQPRRFSMNIFRTKKQVPPTPPEPLPAESPNSTSPAQQPSPADSESSNPSKSTSTTEPKTPTADAVQSKRSKRLETPNDPLPSAPATRLRAKWLRTRRVSSSPDESPLARARAYQVQTPSDPKVHPGDPLNTHNPFPGTAVREIVTEQAETGLDRAPRVWSEDIKMTPVQPKEIRPVPTLEHGLDRVLFK